jgi:hypothetical protein
MRRSDVAFIATAMARITALIAAELIDQVRRRL